MWLTIDDVTLEYSLQVEQLLSPGSAGKSLYQKHWQYIDSSFRRIQ